MNTKFEDIMEFHLNLIQLEASIQTVRRVMAKPEFRSRWLNIFRKSKLQGKSPAEARELANKITGIL